MRKSVAHLYAEALDREIKLQHSGATFYMFLIRAYIDTDLMRLNVFWEFLHFYC